MRTLLLVVTAAAIATSSAFGGELERRERIQQERIGRGVASGSLTPRETARLERREAEIREQLRRDRRDGGRLTSAERARLNRELNQVSQSIHRQKTDSDRSRYAR